MKAELMRLENKGICIVISDLEISALLTAVEDIPVAKKSSPFSNPNKIAELIVEGKKIHAIKEIRYQTGWGLKDAKSYIDRYLGTNYYETARMSEDERKIRDKKAANSFLRDHLSIKNFIETDEFSV